MTSPQNYYEFFGLPVSFQVDSSALKQRYLKLQQQFHPDKYAGKTAQEQRLAAEYAADINQAYNTLKSPLLRAQYLLSLRGIDASGEAAINADVDFLMEQMRLREALAEVDAQENPVSALDQLGDEVQEQCNQLYDFFDQSYERPDNDAALGAVAKLQFFTKLLAEIELQEQELDGF